LQAILVAALTLNRLERLPAVAGFGKYSFMSDMLSTYERIGYEFEIGVYRAGLELEPRSRRLLDALANALSNLSRYEEALDAVGRLLELEPRNPRFHYNRGCALCKLGRLEEALDALRSAFACGFKDIEHLRKDPDLDALRDHAGFIRLTRTAIV
jgi:tetratricopeptide (TPR) repeat protein